VKLKTTLNGLGTIYSGSYYIFFEYSFRVHHLVYQDDQQLLAHAMASDFSVAWQCLSKRTIGFLLRIKLHALILLGVSPPSFDTGARNGVLCGKKIGLAEV
jgi:hypothetical protein